MPAPTKMIAAVFPQRLRDDLDADRDAILLALDRREHLAVLVQHAFDDVGGGELVDGERGRIDLLGRKRLPLRTDGMRSGPQEQAADTIIVVAIEPRIDRTSTRTSTISASSGGSPAHTLESYARDLARARPRTPPAPGGAVDALDRPDARGVRARAARARPVAAIGRAPGRRGARLLPVSRPRSRGSSSNPADDLQPPRAWPALPKFLSLEEVDALIAQPDVVDAARPPRSRDDRAALRDRPARQRARRRPRRRSASRRAVPDVRREGQQGAARADRRAGGRLDRAAIQRTRAARAARRAARRRGCS